jgi:hypothetical protein
MTERAGLMNLWILIPLQKENRWEIPTVNKVAEREGFEPPEACASPVFKTGTLNHSDISPINCLLTSDVPSPT